MQFVLISQRQLLNSRFDFRNRAHDAYSTVPGDFVQAASQFLLQVITAVPQGNIAPIQFASGF
jgi:hypothetical protein